jgi:glycine/D-amino acid oxidase-like deaminating enzyme
LPADDHGCGWLALLPPPAPPRRRVSNQGAQAAVIGAGFTGLAVARQLAVHRPDWRIVVLEAQRVGEGASGRNSGFVVDLPHHEPRRGVEGTRRLMRLGRAGQDVLRTLVRAHEIDCAWTEWGRLHGAVGDVGMRALDTFCEGLDATSEPYTRLSTASMTAITGTAYYRAAVQTRGTVMVQPAALIRGLAAALPANVELFEACPVRGIQRRDGNLVIETGDGTVAAERVFVATNGYTAALGLLRTRLLPMLTFGSLTRTLSDAELRALGGQPEWGLVPEETMGSTVRKTRDGRILIRNSVYYSPSLQVSEAQRRNVREAHRRAFRARFPMLPEVDFEYTWGGVMGISLNGAHFFGELERRLFVAAGYNGVGVALGTIAGQLLADLAVGADSSLLEDMRQQPGPSWIPPEPVSGVAVRAGLAYMARRARQEL